VRAALSPGAAGDERHLTLYSLHVYSLHEFVLALVPRRWKLSRRFGRTVCGGRTGDRASRRSARRGPPRRAGRPRLWRQTLDRRRAPVRARQLRALGRTPATVTDRQHPKLAWIARTDPRLNRVYLFNEGLRYVFIVRGEAPAPTTVPRGNRCGVRLADLLPPRQEPLKSIRANCTANTGDLTATRPAANLRYDRSGLFGPFHTSSVRRTN
jgi:hypothetical protein